MAILLPSGHVSAALAAIYVIAKKLQHEHAFDTWIKGGDGDLIPETGATFPGLIHLINAQRDAFEYEYIQFGFLVYNHNRDVIDRHSVVIGPPYVDFTDRLDKHLRRPCVWIPSAYDAEQTISWLRRQAVAGRIRGYATRRDGIVEDVPQHFWASDQCADVLTYEATTRIAGSNGAFYGRISFPIGEIESLFSPDQPNILPEQAVQPSSYLAFMLQATAALGLTQGRREDGSAIRLSEVKDWLTAHWPAELGPLVATKVDEMAPLLRDMDSARGGRPGREKGSHPFGSSASPTSDGK